MAKAKPLDRLELTRRKMQMRTSPDHHHQGYDKCPVCGAMSLIHEAGCEHCTNCGYDACGLH